MKERNKEIELKIKVLDEIESEIAQPTLDQAAPAADYSTIGLTAATIDAVGKLCSNGKATKMQFIRDFIVKHGYQDSAGLASALNTTLKRLEKSNRIEISGTRRNRLFRPATQVEAGNEVKN